MRLFAARMDEGVGALGEGPLKQREREKKEKLKDQLVRDEGLRSVPETLEPSSCLDGAGCSLTGMLSVS